MAKQSRGTKRTCQNNECGARFYDLDQNPIKCPICGAAYVIASAPLVAGAVVPDERPQRKAKKVEFEEVAADAADLPAAEGDEALADIETDEAVATEEDETFLEEEEEEGGDVTNIIGGPVAEGDEEV